MRQNALFIVSLANIPVFLGGVLARNWTLSSDSGSG